MQLLRLFKKVWIPNRKQESGTEGVGYSGVYKVAICTDHHKKNGEIDISCRIWQFYTELHSELKLLKMLFVWRSQLLMLDTYLVPSTQVSKYPTWVLHPFIRLYAHFHPWKFNSWLIFAASLFQQADSELGRTSRNGSTTKRVVVSSSRPSSSGEAGENRTSRLGSGSGRLSTTQRIQPGFESKSSSFTRATATRAGREDPLRSFELLTIGTGKRK